MLNVNKQNNTFLPPLKPSRNRLQVTSDKPVYLENSLGKPNEMLQLSVDKFHVLTKQPKSEEYVKLNSPAMFTRSNRFSTNNNIPETTPVNFKWSSAEMPRLKISKQSKQAGTNAHGLDESIDEKRKRLLFEQKCSLEHKFFEKDLRQARSLEFQQHSSETFKKIRRREKKKESKKGSQSGSERIQKPDVWASDNFKDINLNKEIIVHFYSTDNRHIRYFRNSKNNEHFLHKPNKCFTKLEETLLGREEAVSKDVVAKEETKKPDNSNDE
jgi:hypothetical protein